MISNNNYDTQQLLSKANSISSLKPVRDLNTSYIADRLNQTMISQYPDRFNSINSYSSYHINNLINKRSTSNSRSNSRPHRNNSKIITSEYRSKSKLLKSSTNSIMNPYSIKPSTDFTIINSSKIYPLENCQNTRIFN